MNELDLQYKIEQYYKTLIKPEYKVSDWIIANTSLYLLLKDKLTITHISYTNFYERETIIVLEGQSKYYAIKYSGSFLCLRESETELGLLTGEYDLLAVREGVLKSKIKHNVPSFKSICKLFNWKLSKKAKEYLDYPK